MARKYTKITRWVFKLSCRLTYGSNVVVWTRRAIVRELGQIDNPFMDRVFPEIIFRLVTFYMIFLWINPHHKTIAFFRLVLQCISLNR